MKATCCRTLRFGDDEAWSKERKGRIGSSEMAGILGLGYADQTPYTIWLQKTTGKRLPKDDGFKLMMKIGNAAEPFLRELFFLKTGKVCHFDEVKTVRVNDEYPAFHASVDGWCYEEDGSESIVELKFIGMQARGEYLADDAPLKYSIQVQHQMAVTGTQRGYLFACCGNEPVIREVPRHQRLIDAMHLQAEQFMALVESKTPPPVDGRDATRKAIGLYHGEPSANKIVNLPSEFSDHPDQIAKLEDEIKASEEELGRLKNEIRQFMGDAEYAYTQCGTTRSWKNAGKSRTFRQVKAPAIVKRHLLNTMGR